MSLNSERFPLTSGLKNKHSENDGFKVIFVCFVVFSIAITVALIVQIYYGQPEVVPHAAVSSDHRTCSSIGDQLLRRGGSAVDAAVATALCMTVVHPHTTGLGGGGFMLIHDHARNRSVVVDFREVAPAGTDRRANVSRSGARSAGVPGLLRGLETAHREYGRLPWPELVKPSILLAREGTGVSPQLASALRNYLTLQEAQATMGMSVFVSEDRLLQEGDQLIVPDLADTLVQVQARGADALYEGVLTNVTLEELALAGGIISEQDMQNYKPLLYEGLMTQHGNFTLLTSAAPSAGPALLAAVHLLRHSNLSAAPDPATRYHRITEALSTSMDQFSRLGDPVAYAEVTNRTERLLSPAVLSELSEGTSDVSLVAASPLPPLPTPAASHVSVIDPQELYVSVVSGLGSYFGSKFRSGSGVLFSNAMAAFYDPSQSSTGTLNLPAADRRPLTTYSPAILMAHKVCGRRVVTGGSDASLLAQAIVRLLDPRENLTTAIEGPRLHVSQNSGRLGLEGEHPLQLEGDTVEALQHLGHTVYSIDPPYPSCNAITKHADTLSSHSDSRGGGTASRF